MKTLIIAGATPVPAGVREVVEHGSTSLEERRAADVVATTSGVDRVVFWATKQDADLRALAERYVRAERQQRREVIVYVTPDEGATVPGLAANELFVWPRDEDRLKMAFMTGA